MKDVIPGIDIVTTGEDQTLTNKTITSPVLEGIVNTGTKGVTFGKVNMGATNVTTLGASGVANFASNVGVTGTLKATGNATFANVILTNLIRFGANATLAANGLTLNANYYLAVQDLAGTTYYLPCANAVW